jgi:hypothetical protein
MAEKTCKRHYPDPPELHKQQDHYLSEQGEKAAGINDYQPGDTNSTCGGKEGVNK